MTVMIAPARKGPGATNTITGLLTTHMDCHYASWLLQHGEGIDDFLTAHILASTASFAELEEAWFLAAAALDRYLMFVDQPQRFRSQSSDAAGMSCGSPTRTPTSS